MDDEGLERQREALREALRLCNRQIAERGDASPALNQQQPSPAPPPAPAAPTAAIAASPSIPQPSTAMSTPAAAASTYAATPLINQPSAYATTPLINQSSVNQASDSVQTPEYPVTRANPSSVSSAPTAPSFVPPDTASALASIANNRAINRPSAVPQASFANLPAQPLFRDQPSRPETPPAYEEYTYRGRARGRGRGRTEGGRAGRIYTIFVCRAHDTVYCQQCCLYVASDIYWARHPELTEE